MHECQGPVPGNHSDSGFLVANSAAKLMLRSALGCGSPEKPVRADASYESPQMIFWAPPVFDDRIDGDEAHRRLRTSALPSPPVGSALAPPWLRSCQEVRGAIVARNCISIIDSQDTPHAQVTLSWSVCENRTSGGGGDTTFRKKSSISMMRVFSPRCAISLRRSRETARRHSDLLQKTLFHHRRLRPRCSVTP